MFKRVVVIRGIAATLLAGAAAGRRGSCRAIMAGGGIGATRRVQFRLWGGPTKKPLRWGYKPSMKSRVGCWERDWRLCWKTVEGLRKGAAAALKKLITVEGVVMSVGETQSQNALMEAEIAERFHHPLIIAEALADDVTAGMAVMCFGPAHATAESFTTL